jgi:[acyl-carrier-protein] S-malonyltransferase
VKSKINDLSKELKKRQIVSMNLPVSTAFHCKMLENMKEEFNDILQKVNFDTPVCKIIRNYDCKIYSSAKDIREGLLLQLTNPVLFYQSIKTVENAIPYY